MSVTSSLSKDEDAIPQQLENTLLRGGNPVPAASNAANTSRTVKPVPEVKVIIHSFVVPVSFMYSSLKKVLNIVLLAGHR